MCVSNNTTSVFPESVVVSVFGRDYPIRATAEQESISAAAGLLNERMEAVAGRMRQRVRDSIAVLAGMSLADDLRRQQSKRNEEQAQTTKRLRALCERLERVLHRGTKAT
jgi:cell division protein ZapA (FtsZ GTPase activity inhibitor)